MANKDTKKAKFVLCYVDGDWAYFTTNKLSEQWGDDWDDAPYEHNAETPYEYSQHDKDKGIEPWEILKVAFDGEFDAPCSNYAYNSPWSVEQINSGAIAWLHSSPWGKKPISIPAGTTIDRFCELIKEGGGRVYFPKQE